MTNNYQARQELSGQLSVGDAAEGEGLSMYHISPQNPPVEETKHPKKSRITIWRGASLLAVELGKIKGARGNRPDWTRGTITKFTKNSRRRVMRLIATIKRIPISCFITLTYPDMFERDPKQVKKHLDTFFKRLVRKFPDVIVVWRMEAQKRKSGNNAGEIAPHFHLLIWNVDYKSLLSWIPANWYAVVGSGDEKHLMAGTRVERVRSSNGVMYYTSKYICKALDYHLEGWGRYWGVINREFLKTIQGEKTTIEIDDMTAITVMRYMRRKASEVYRKGKFIGRRKFPKWGHKFTLIGNADFWASAVEKMQNTPHDTE